MFVFDSSSLHALCKLSVLLSLFVSFVFCLSLLEFPTARFLTFLPHCTRASLQITSSALIYFLAHFLSLGCLRLSSPQHLSQRTKHICEYNIPDVFVRHIKFICECVYIVCVSVIHIYRWFWILTLVFSIIPAFTLVDAQCYTATRMYRENDWEPGSM